MSIYEVEFWEKVYIAAIRADKAVDTAARIATEAVRLHQMHCK